MKKKKNNKCNNKNKWVRDTTYAKIRQTASITTIKLKNKVIELKICLPFFYFALRSISSGIIFFRNLSKWERFRKMKKKEKEKKKKTIHLNIFNDSHWISILFATKIQPFLPRYISIALNKQTQIFQWKKNILKKNGFFFI